MVKTAVSLVSELSLTFQTHISRKLLSKFVSAAFTIQLILSTNVLSTKSIDPNESYQYETDLRVITSFHHQCQLQHQEKWRTFNLFMY